MVYYNEKVLITPNMLWRKVYLLTRRIAIKELDGAVYIILPMIDMVEKRIKVKIYFHPICTSSLLRIEIFYEKNRS
jgi:hypothetical protein